jgi:7,8-dihydropterin-6-yl-methyl-4-(beta-D-ribofuranosyl)aminobenzene 5'-phosphate synthase
MKKIIIAVLLSLAINGLQAQQVQQLKITILSTMVADTLGKGEWGFSALVEADGRKILFDTGTDSTLAISNAKLFGIDLSDVKVLVLSHCHADHTGGWPVLKNHFPGFDTTYTGEGFFLARYHKNNSFWYSRSNDSARYVTEGGHVKVLSTFTQIYPGIYLTGPVPRKFDEKNYLIGPQIMSGGNLIQDDVPEDMSMIFSTSKGLVILSGCSHSGIINTLDYTQKNLAGNLYAAIGGFHLYAATDDRIKWTAGKLKQAGIVNFIGAHCTGLNTVYEIRQLCGLKRENCVVGAVGSVFDLTHGIGTGLLAQ